MLPLAIESYRPNCRPSTRYSPWGCCYHRRSPLDHLLELRDCLRPGGQLVLETLVIEGGPGMSLVPEGRYARMGNVWFLPACDTLLGWLRKLGFVDCRLVDVSATSTREQRSTDWMRFQSLADFLDPADRGKTVEGYPAPRRAIVTARQRLGSRGGPAPHEHRFSQNLPCAAPPSGIASICGIPRKYTGCPITGCETGPAGRIDVSFPMHASHKHAPARCRS